MRDIFTSLFCFRKELRLRVGVGSNFDSVDFRRRDWRAYAVGARVYTSHRIRQDFLLENVCFSSHTQYSINTLQLYSIGQSLPSI